LQFCRETARRFVFWFNFAVVSQSFFSVFFSVLISDVQDTFQIILKIQDNIVPNSILKLQNKDTTVLFIFTCTLL